MNITTKNCNYCSHYHVCKYREEFVKMQNSIEGLDYIEPVELCCKYCEYTPNVIYCIHKPKNPYGDKDASKVKVMNIIVGKRGSGRTVNLIQECAKKKGSVIVCATSYAACRVANMAREMGYVIREPICFDDFYKRRNTEGVSGYLFDDLDLILKCLAGGSSIEAATFELDSRSNII